MFGHMFYFGHMTPIFGLLLLIVAAVVVVRELRRRDAPARSQDDARALAVLEEVKATLARLEARVESLEILLPEKPGRAGRETPGPDGSGKRGRL